MKTRSTTRTESRARADLKPGDTFWFSGYWCTFVRFAPDGRGYGRFPYTPADQEVWMFHAEDSTSDYYKKWGPHSVTVKLGPEGNP